LGPRPRRQLPQLTLSITSWAHHTHVNTHKHIHKCTSRKMRRKNKNTKLKLDLNITGNRKQKPLRKVALQPPARPTRQQRATTTTTTTMMMAMMMVMMMMMRRWTKLLRPNREKKRAVCQLHQRTTNVESGESSMCPFNQQMKCKPRLEAGLGATACTALDALVLPSIN